MYARPARINLIFFIIECKAHQHVGYEVLRRRMFQLVLSKHSMLQGNEQGSGSGIQGSEHCFRTWQLAKACEFYLGRVSNDSRKLITTLSYAILVLTDVSVGTKVTGCVGERASRGSLPAKF